MSKQEKLKVFVDQLQFEMTKLSAYGGCAVESVLPCVLVRKFPLPDVHSVLVLGFFQVPPWKESGVKEVVNEGGEGNALQILNNFHKHIQKHIIIIIIIIIIIPFSKHQRNQL